MGIKAYAVACAYGFEYVILIAEGDTEKPFLAQDFFKERDPWRL